MTKGMNMSKGVINSYTNNNKLLFEINEILGKEILVVTRLAHPNYINAGSISPIRKITG